MNNQFSKDLYRYYGEKGEGLKDRLLRPVELKYIALFQESKHLQICAVKAFLYS